MLNSKIATSRQKKIFYEKNIWVSILIVSIPALLLAMMAGAYAFCDQLLMVQLIPKWLSANNVFGGELNTNYNEIFNNPQYSNIGLLDPNQSISSIIRTCVSYGAPVTVFINAMALLMGNGTAINYSKYSGAKNYTQSEKVWTQGFWCNMLLSLIVIVVICAFCDLFVSFEQGQGLNQSLSVIKEKMGSESENFKIVSNYYNAYYDYVKQYTTQFIYVIGGGSILCLYSQFISLLVIAEGKQWIIVIASIVCNAFNVFFDYLMIHYGHMTLISGAIAMDLGWTLNVAICFAYIWYLNRRNLTNLHLSALRRVNFVFKDYWELFRLGLPSFCRNLSMAIATTIQIVLIVKVVGDVNASIQGTTIPIATYQTFYGAVNPIYNLFFTAQVGIINGARIVCSYNYGANNNKRVRGSYLALITFALIYGLVMFFLICYGLNTSLLSLFAVDPSNLNYGLCNQMLMATIMQMPIIAIGIGGMMLFQATGRWKMACIAGLMQGLICCLPISFLLQFLAIHYQTISLFIWTPFIIGACASIIVTIWSAIYIRIHFTDKNLNKIAK